MPEGWVTAVAGVRVTVPALTAIDLSGGQLGGDPIDRVLRLRRATLLQLQAALDATANRDGNVSRRQLLLDSRAEPWSAAERATHVLFRRARITGWSANVELKLLVDDEAVTYYPDLCFRRERLIIEVDSRTHHDHDDAYERDRYRQNDLVLNGWRVLRFTWDMVANHPDYVIRRVRDALR